MFQTEFEFQLPRGYLDPEGTLHRDGTMRLANAGDEILPLKDPRVQANQAYLVIILFSRVITRLGELETLDPKIIEQLFSGDLLYLQEFYNRINGLDDGRTMVMCPHCRQEFASSRTGGIVGYPLTQLRGEVAYLGMHLHWAHDALMNLEHDERRQWVAEVRRLEPVFHGRER